MKYYPLLLRICLTAIAATKAYLAITYSFPWPYNLFVIAPLAFALPGQIRLCVIALAVNSAYKIAKFLPDLMVASNPSKSVFSPDGTMLSLELLLPLAISIAAAILAGFNRVAVAGALAILAELWILFGIEFLRF